MEDLHLIARIYDTYTKSKESFIDRNFQTNRFMMALCLILLVSAYFSMVLVPDLICTIILSAFGLLISALWWMNLDTYQFMIKIKYAKVLEKIEENFPVKPCQEEFIQSQEVKKKKKLAIFPDLQKGFAFLIIITFVVLFSASLATKMTQQPFSQQNSQNAPSIEVIE